MTERAELVAVLRRALIAPHAKAVADELGKVKKWYRRADRIQKKARAVRRTGAGRPTDVAERQMEARVLDVLAHNGIPTPKASKGSIAETVLALMRGVASEDAANATRRARLRLDGLAYFREVADREGPDALAALLRSLRPRPAKKTRR